MTTCTWHSIWCPLLSSSFLNVTANNSASRNTTTCGNLFDSPVGEEFTRNNKWITSCCELWCGKQGSQFLQLQCMGASETMAMVTWFMVIILALCAALQLVSVFLERGARKVAMVGGPLFLAFISIIVYLVTSRVSESFQEPLYPVVGAMNVAAFSYYFSSFQYSIGLVYELASATALIFSMLPIWLVLMRIMQKSTEAFSFYLRLRVDWNLVAFMGGIVFVMLVLSILWIVHSSLYRTIGYRAAWITAFNKQVVETRLPRRNFISNLWVLAGAQGHPTWRTPVGQSIGLYLSMLSWLTTATVLKLLQKSYCKEDLILFHILLWVPPIILTISVLTTQFTVCSRASRESDNLFSKKWFQDEFQTLKETYTHMEEAVISYRLGRDSLEVETNNITRFRLQFAGWEMDKFVGKSVFFIEALIMGIASPGILLLKLVQMVGICIIKRAPGANVIIPSEVCTLNEKIQAFRIFCEYCVSEDTSEYYEQVCNLESHNLADSEVTSRLHEEICNIFRRHRRNIRLSLLLDNVGPSRLSYLLEELVFVLNELGDHSTEMREADVNEAAVRSEITGEMAPFITTPNVDSAGMSRRNTSRF